MVDVAIRDSLLAMGSMVDHFKVMRQLGAGGMGEVYLARDTKLGRKVALKVISASRIGKEAAVESFLDEARMTARFNHPHIVTIYAVGEHEGCPYLALEYLEGQTLRQRMREQMPSLKESLRMGMAIAEALSEAHRMQVLHRDLKPENVLLPKDGRLRVVDFGIAKALSNENATSETIQVSAAAITSAAAENKREVSGTPSYIAPELWQEEEATPAVDVWALGVILHELFVGRHPFEGTRDAPYLAGLLSAVLSPEAVTIDPQTRSQSPEMAQLVEDCLCKDPKVRPTAQQVAERFGRLLSRGERTLSAQDSPFRGLQPFSEQHAAYFFGREAEVAAFLERMRVDPVLPVLGPSGSGKSSFVQAGVIPMLREQGRWTVLQLRPGNRPFNTLATRIMQGESVSQSPVEGLRTAVDGARRSQDRARTQENEIEQLAAQLQQRPEQLFIRLHALAEAEGARVLLFIDQLEELYTLVEDEAVRQQFMRAICAAADDPADPVRVIFTLRDDFLGRVAEGVEARNALSHVTVIRSPGPEALKEVLTRGAYAAEYTFDQPDLVPRMVAAVQGEPACLALLQFAARMLWERRDEERRQLLTSAYEAIGGVEGALAEHADGVLEGLSTAQVRTARDLLLRLVTAESTRRVIARRSALEGLGPEAEEVLGRLVQARLVTVRRAREEDSSEAELELVHESLIHSWGRLQRWVEESREDRAVLAEIGQAAELWERRGRREEEVWYGEALAEALRLMARCSSPVPEKVTRFLQAGSKREGRRVRRRRLLLTSAGVLLGSVAVVSVIVAMIVAEKSREVRIQRDRAEEQRREVRRRWAEAQREGARAALGRGDLLEAAAKLRGSLETQDSPLSRALWWQLTKDPLLWQKRLGAVVYDVAFFPDGVSLAAACQDRTVYVFDVQTARVRVLRGHADQVISVAVSPDGRRIASGSISGLVRLVDLEKGTVRHLTGGSGVIRRLAFNPQGSRLAAAIWDKSVRVWDLEAGAEPRVLRGHTANVSGVAWTPDGQRLLSAALDRTLRLWDATSGRQLKLLEGHEDGVFSLALSPNGQLAASGSGDKTIRVWRLDADEPPRVLKGHTAGVTALLFSRDGQRVVSGSLDRTIRVWELGPTGRTRVIAHHPDGVNSLALSPDGHRVASAGPDKTIRLWNLDTSAAASTVADLSAGVLGIAFSPDGRRLAAGSMDSTVRLWDVASAALVRQLQGHSARVFAVAISPDGATLASGSQDKTIRLWDLAKDAETRVFEGHADAVRCLAFSPDGKLLASGGADKVVRLWDVAGGAVRRTLGGHALGVYSVRFSPDGKTLATASGDRTIRLWDAASGRVLSTLSGHSEGVNGLAFSPDGRQLASGGWDRTVRVWDLAKRTGRVVGQHDGRVYWLDFHPDGQRVGAPSSDGVARIWDLNGRYATLEGHQAEVNYLRFSPDGAIVATASDDGTVRLWDATTARPIWRSPLLFTPTMELFTHRGWIPLEQARVASTTSRWRRAVEERAVSGAVKEGGVLCLRTHEASLEIWDLAQDKRLLAEPIPRLRRVLAHPDGCVTLADGQVRLYSRAGSFRELATGATAVAEERGEILVAAERQVLIFDGAGEPRGKHAADVGVTAMLHTRDVMVIGFKEGTIEVISRRGPAVRTSLTLQEVPSSPIVTLLGGPMGTLVVGFANGLFGIWDMSNGSRLYAANLHGPVVHALVRGGKLFAASELGDFQVIDLSAFETNYCTLVRDVWRSVPVVWEDGLPVRRQPPPDHGCSRR